ncbi:hypothetical protein F3Y22_tig00110809pilonHSYRG00129 [Hibiscus syriacus]|uniref:Uncharacterized protein n=1 Tax=Hibiscus syriacus TaxID=106335 RepID=A0A6A2ZQY6_HIBSY|nr:hypothetical protein F3Y22_tig00110809pilonHSYRG00129 [Hibiscus syriacus]
MERSSMWRACASKRAFWIGVLCAILTPVAKVMAKRLKHTQNDTNEEHVTINSRLCADLPTHGISAPSTCNLTAQHHLSRIPPASVFQVGSNDHFWEFILGLGCKRAESSSSIAELDSNSKTLNAFREAYQIVFSNLRFFLFSLYRKTRASRSSPPTWEAWLLIPATFGSVMVGTVPTSSDEDET